MIEDPQIVQETRKVRCSISERFGNDPDRYIDYLLSQQDEAKAESNPSPDETRGTEQTSDYPDRY